MKPARIKRFKIYQNDIQLETTSSGLTYCESVGRRAAIFGYQAGIFEGWVYPFKIVSDLKFSLFIPERNFTISGEKIFHRSIIRPELTTLIYSHELFMLQIHLLTPLCEPGSLLLVECDTFVELELWVQFVPNLIPMWPAGLGGQYTLWLDELSAYFIGEGSKKYVGLIGSPHAAKMSSTPGHQLPDDPMKFVVKIMPEIAHQQFYPICLSGSIQGKAEAIENYKKLLKKAAQFYQQKRRHFAKVQNEKMTIKTPVANLDAAFQWAKVGLDQGIVENPQLGIGLVAGYGISGKTHRPGFAWFFGGDTCINSLAMCCYGEFEKTKVALSLLQKYQRADGKISHEITQSAALINWFEDYPYGYYHADTSAYFIIAMHNYWQHSGDADFIKASWEAILKAYNYCLATDQDDDGLMENSAAGLAALEVGKLPHKIQVDIYLAALWLQAIRNMLEFSELMNNSDLKQSCEDQFAKAIQSFHKIFLDEKKRRLNFALLTNGQLCPDATVWQAVPLFFDLMEHEKISKTLIEFAASEMSTDWGVRSVSSKNKNYDPCDYNNGSVWPFTTGYVATAQYKNFQSKNGWHNLLANADLTFLTATGYQTELLSGEYYRPLITSVPHQLFSASGIILPLVIGLFGLEGDARSRRIKCAPQIPADWQEFSISNYRCGKNTFNFKFERNQEKLQLRVTNIGEFPYRLFFAPSFGLGTKIINVFVNGNKEQFAVQQKRWCLLCAVEPEINKNLEIEIQYEMGFEFSLPLPKNQVGARSHGLKLLDFELHQNIFKMIVEGISGKTYVIPLQTRFHIGKIEGGTIQQIDRSNSQLKIKFPANNTGKYSRKEIKIHLIE